MDIDCNKFKDVNGIQELKSTDINNKSISYFSKGLNNFKKKMSNGDIEKRQRQNSIEDYSKESMLKMLSPSNTDPIEIQPYKSENSYNTSLLSPQESENINVTSLTGGTCSSCPEMLSYSMIIDDKHQDEKHTPVENLLSVSPRQTFQWIPDDKVTNCYACNSEFTFWLRKHHCRVCGRTFCYSCSSNRHKIPNNVACSKNTSQIKQIADSYLYQGYIRVCDYCYTKIQRLEKLDKYIKVFEQIDLDIEDYQIMTQNYNVWVNKLINLQHQQRNINLFKSYNLPFNGKYGIQTDIKLWSQISKFFLSAFRGIQYYLPTHKFGPLDEKLLWNNRKHIYNHSKYAVQLIKCFMNDKNKLDQILDLYENNIKSKKTCWDLMCSRNCKSHINCEDLLTLWRQDLTNTRLRFFLVKYFNTIDDYEFLAYLPIIIEKIIYDTDTNPIIQTFILNKIDNNLYLTNQVYWNLKMASLNRKNGKIYSDFLSKLIMGLNVDLFNSIIEGENLVTMLQSIPKDLTKEDDIKNFIKIKSISRKVRNPIDLQHSCTISAPNIIVKTSYERPIIVSFEQPTSHTNVTKPLHKSDIDIEDDDDSDFITDNKVTIKRLLYKAEDIRKDLLIMNLIRLVHKIIRDELKLDTKTVTYDIIPTSHNTGIIEMVDNCETIANIRDNKKLSILNHIMNHNQHVSVEELRKNFMYSCATYCITTYLLGIGDRHLDNILVTKQGQLFHVDYSYILGEEPKPLTKPRMRICPEMIDALGGANSEEFKHFCELCTLMYNCLRRHVNLFINIMTFLAELDPPVSRHPSYFSIDNNTTTERIVSELLDRFVPGEGYQQAKIQIYNVIGTSSAPYHQYHHAFIDFFHHHQQEKTINQLLNTTYTSAVSYINYLYDIVSYYVSDSKDESDPAHNN